MEFYAFMNLWANENGIFILMFLVSGVFLSLFLEVVKKQIFPKLSDEDKEKGKIERKCPAWAGMLLGLFGTGVFMACAILASLNGVAHSSIPGGLWFLPIWAIGFYLWQWLAGRAVKAVLKRITPCFMTGKPRNPHVDKPTFEVPKGAKIKWVDPLEE